MSTKPAHTPGPWTTQVPSIPITRLAAEDRMVLARAFDGSNKAVVDRVRGGSPEQANANALLIAAAPDLFDIARSIVAVCESGDTNLAHLACMETSPLVDAARAAIAKAEGRA